MERPLVLLFLLACLWAGTLRAELDKLGRRSRLLDDLRTHLYLTGVVAEEPQVYAERQRGTISCVWWPKAPSGWPMTPARCCWSRRNGDGSEEQKDSQMAARIKIRQTSIARGKSLVQLTN